MQQKMLRINNWPLIRRYDLFERDAPGLGPSGVDDAEIFPTRLTIIHETVRRNLAGVIIILIPS